MKYIKYFLIVAIPVLAIAAYFLYPKYQRGLEIEAAMEGKNNLHTFTHMDELFPAKEVLKSSNPHIFPKGNAIQLPKEFASKSFISALFGIAIDNGSWEN